MNRHYEPTSNRARAAFAAVALTITVALGAGIDTLSFRYGPEGTAAAAAWPAVAVAQADVRWAAARR